MINLLEAKFLKLNFTKNPQNKKIYKINVASGRNAVKGFINLDNSLFLYLLPFYPFFKKFIKKEYRFIFDKFLKQSSIYIYKKHNCKRRLPFSKNSVSHILCSHFLEHVYLDQASIILNDFKRVLTSEGTLHLIVPDLKFYALSYVESENTEASYEFIENLTLTRRTEPSIFYKFINNFLDNGLNHKWMYDFKGLKKLLLENGFQIIDEISIKYSDPRYDLKSEGEIHIYAKPII